MTVVGDASYERTPPTPYLVGIAILLALSIAMTIVRDRRYSDPNANAPALLDVRSGGALERTTLSFDAIAADVYWIRAVQHYGGAHGPKGTHQYPLLYPLLDLTTTLDPRFNIAYRFGALFLSEPYPGGAGRPDLAIELLKKGIRVQPHRWEYFQDIAFIHYWHFHDYKTASEWYAQGSAVPGAPWWLRSLAAVTIAKGGDRSASRFMWERILAGADNEWLQREAIRRLNQLKALDQIDELQKVVTAYRAHTGRTPDSWEALVRERILRGIPVDPAGFVYQLDAATGTVTVARNSTLSPLPTEPPPGQQPATP